MRDIIEQPKKSNNFFNEIDRNIFSIYRYFMEILKISKNIDIYILGKKLISYRLEIADIAHHYYSAVTIAPQSSLYLVVFNMNFPCNTDL